MDVALAYRENIHEEVYWAVANLFNLEVDLIFFDTTSTYFERDQEDGLRRYAHSKDHRDDLPQIVIGLAVTKEGIPVKCWVMPGNTSDMKTVQMVKNDLQGWKLGRCVWVMDRGMSSEQNRIILQQAGGLTLIAGKPKGGKSLLMANLAVAMATGGRFLNIPFEGPEKVIMFSLEESRRRLNDRFRRMIGDNSDGMGNVVIRFEAQRIGSGFEDDLQDVIEKHKPRLESTKWHQPLLPAAR